MINYDLTDLRLFLAAAQKKTAETGGGFRFHDRIGREPTNQKT